MHYNSKGLSLFLIFLYLFIFITKSAYDTEDWSNDAENSALPSQK